MNKLIATLIVALLTLSGESQARGTGVRYVFQKSNDVPITTFNVTFQTGSADDPKGSEGLAALTAELVREGGVLATTIGSKQLPARSRAELEEFLYPLSAEIGVSVEKEQTSFHVTTSAADAETVFGVLAQVILAPAWNQGEFERLKSETLDALTKQLPREDQEELGKAVLDQAIYGAGHPYAHVVEGTVSAVNNASVEKIKEFYRAHYTAARAVVGVAGVISPPLERAIRQSFSRLPRGGESRASVARVERPSSPQLTIVKGAFDATGVHLGQTISINRASAEFPGLYLASWAFGKHRSFVGRLMNVVREVRGLNYGTYSYVQDFPEGGHRLTEPTQAARSHHAFTVWGRPTTLENGCFLLRQIHREVLSLHDRGLRPEEFKLARSHLVGNAPLLATGLERRLGYAIDSVFYGIKGDYLMSLQSRAKTLKAAEVSALLKKHLEPSGLDIVVVTPDPERFKSQLLSEKCTITYAPGVEKPQEVLEEDKQISTHKLEVKASDIRIIDSEKVFER